MIQLQKRKLNILCETHLIERHVKQLYIYVMCALEDSLHDANPKSLKNRIIFKFSNKI